MDKVRKNYIKEIVKESLENLNITVNDDNKETIKELANNNINIYDYKELVGFINDCYAHDIKTDNPYITFNYDSFIRDCIYGSDLYYNDIERDLFNEKWLKNTLYIFRTDIENFEYELECYL